MQVAVVILNFNGRTFLEKFLPNVIENTPNYPIIIADNASTDDSVKFIQDNFPNLTLIQLPQNGGFSKGYNEALKQIESEYYLLLNSDIEVSPYWVEPLVEAMEKNPNLAACQPKIRSYYQKTYFEYAGAAGGWIDKWGYPFCRGRIFDTVEQDEGQYNDFQLIFWATGAAMLVRAKIYWELDGLEEEFFAHMEEIDWCWRAKNLGYHIAYVPESTVFHVGGGTLPKNNPFKTYLNFRNNLALLYKNLPASRLFWVLSIRFVLDMLAVGQFFLKKQGKDGFAILKAYRDFWKKIPYWYQKRKKVQKNIQKIPKLFPKSIVWQYFLKKKKRFVDL